MIRARALEISDALVERGESHKITIGVYDGMLPRERYTVSVEPLIAYSAIDITKLQRIADVLGCVIAYVNGSFVFGEQS